MTKVSAMQMDTPLQPLDAEMKDSVPEAVSGFLSTLGLNLTQEQKDQLHVMLERPSNEADIADEESKRRKTAPGTQTSGG